MATKQKFNPKKATFSITEELLKELRNKALNDSLEHRSEVGGYLLGRFNYENNDIEVLDFFERAEIVDEGSFVFGKSIENAKKTNKEIGKKPFLKNNGFQVIGSWHSHPLTDQDLKEHNMDKEDLLRQLIASEPDLHNEEWFVSDLELPVGLGLIVILDLTDFNFLKKDRNEAKLVAKKQSEPVNTRRIYPFLTWCEWGGHHRIPKIDLVENNGFRERFRTELKELNLPRGYFEESEISKRLRAKFG